MDSAAKVSLLLSLGLFPACGHHRAVASVRLAKQLNTDEYKIWSVKVIAPPAGKDWDERIRTLGYFDNLPFGTRLSLRDKMLYIRRDFVDNHSDTSGNWLEPVEEHKANFRKYLKTYLGSTSSQTLQSWQGLICRPSNLWSMVLKIMDPTKVHNLPGEDYRPLKAPNSVHALASLPNEQMHDLLKKIIKRELTVKAANADAKRLKSVCNCREHIIYIAQQKDPKRTKNLEDWSHFTNLWPSLGELAYNYQGYFANQKGRSKRVNVPGLNSKIRRTMDWDDQIRAGSQAVAVVDREDLPFLKAAEDDKKVFVAVCGKHYFILLNTKTENASQYLKPHEYRKFCFCFCVLFCFVLICI